jgi:hypothetical protein
MGNAKLGGDGGKNVSANNLFHNAHLGRAQSECPRKAAFGRLVRLRIHGDDGHSRPIDVEDR